ncbi:MAG TPA: DUF3048 domain-containing protein [Patescibacteria group bacterium]|nr:DUF3048 domain-containing protein [Patescibacteria group bacterium]
MKKQTLIALIAVGIFGVSAGISMYIFSAVFPPTRLIQTVPPTKLANGTVAFNPALPKTQPCPMNGVKYSTQQEAWWKQHRPLIVMIENSVDARPQSGISYADQVFEAVAEGGITRFAVLFYCQDAPEIGPVRSARTYFIDFASGFGASPLYAHVGGANAAGPADALGQLEQYGWAGYNDLNQFSIGFPAFWRDYTRTGKTVATEHTMYSTTTKLWDFAKTSRGLTNVDKNGVAWDANFVPYSFQDPASQKGTTQKVSVQIWPDQNDYFVNWVYDVMSNTYKRFDGNNSPYIDFDTKKQLSATTLVILKMKEENASDGYLNNEHLLYDDIGVGNATIFMEGKQINGTWKKASRTAQLTIYSANGSPFPFDRGLIWFTIVPPEGTVSVQ